MGNGAAKRSGPRTAGRLTVGGRHMRTKSDANSDVAFEKSARKLFRLIDADADGELSFDEVLRYVESSMQSAGHSDEAARAETKALMAALGLADLSHVTVFVFVQKLRAAYDCDPKRTARAVQKALKLMAKRKQQDSKTSERVGYPSTGSKHEDHADRDAHNDLHSKDTHAHAPPLLDAHGNPTNALLLENLRSVKEAVGISATALLLDTRAFDTAKENLQKLQADAPREVMNRTRAEFMLGKHQAARDKSRAMDTHNIQAVEENRASQARYIGSQLVAGDVQYRSALEDIIHNGAHAMEELNKLAAEIQNVGPLSKGDRAHVVRNGALVPVQVTRTVGDLIEVSVFKTVDDELDKPYEEGYDTSHQELRFYPRVELYTVQNLRQTLFNSEATLRIGDEVQAMHEGEAVRAQVEHFDPSADKVELLVLYTLRPTRARLRLTTARADIWFDASPAGLGKRNPNKRRGSRHRTRAPPFATLAKDAIEGQTRVFIERRDGSPLPESVTLGLGTGEEERATVTAFGSVVLKAPLLKNHPEVPGVMGAAAAGNTRLDIDIYNGAKLIGDSIALGVGTPDEEVAYIAGFESLLLQEGLEHPHERNSVIDLHTPVNSVRFLATLYGDANATRTRLDRLAQHVQQQVTKKLGIRVVVHLPRVKDIKRSLTKTQEKYGGDFGWLTDLARMTFECPTSECALMVLQLLRAHAGWEVVRLKNRLMPEFDASKSGGYRDMLVNLRDRVNGHIGEAQITLGNLLAIKNSGGHDVYKVARLLDLNERHTTGFAGVPQGRSLEAVGCGLTRNLEIYGLSPSSSQLAQLYSTRGLQSPTCAIQKLILHSIAGMRGWTVAKAVMRIGKHVGVNMQKLTLDNCGLTGPIPADIASVCPNLEELVLQHNPGIVGGIPERLAEMGFLKVLNLSGCSLEGKIPEALGTGLLRLRGLYLHNNRFTGAIPSSFGRLQHVADLFLHGNALSHSIPATLKKMPQLRRLVLSHNNLTGAIPEGLATNPRLQVLFVNHNELSGKVPDALVANTALRQLAINDNKPCAGGTHGRTALTAPTVPHKAVVRNLTSAKRLLKVLSLTSLGHLASNPRYRKGMLKASGVTASELKEKLFSATDISELGFTLDDLCGAKFSASELREACYSAKALKDKFSPFELLEAGYKVYDLTAAGFSPVELLKGAAVTLSQLVNFYDTAEKRLDAVFELKAAGCTAGELKAADLTGEQLKAAGFTAKELKEAGFSLDQLKATGYPLEDLAQSGFTLGELKRADFTVEALKAEGFTASQFKAEGFAIGALVQAGFTLPQLKQAHFSRDQLVQAGFTLAQLKDADFTLEQLIAAGFTLPQLKEVHFTVGELKQAGFTLDQLQASGFDPSQLKQAMFTANDLSEVGITLGELKQAGFDAGQLKDSGFTVTQLHAAGFTAGQLKRAKFSLMQLIKCGFSLLQLRLSGHTADQLRSAGFTLEQLKDAGFTVDQLRSAFTAGQLKAAFHPK